MLMCAPKPSLSLYRLLSIHSSARRGDPVPQQAGYRTHVGQVVNLRRIGNPPVPTPIETPIPEKPLSQITTAKRHYPNRNPGKNTPIASSFIIWFVKHRTGKSAMMSTIGTCDLNGAATVTERFPREHEFSAPGQLAERFTPEPATQPPPACAIGAGKSALASRKNANPRKLTTAT
jgi:hypothetical protein